MTKEALDVHSKVSRLIIDINHQPFILSRKRDSNTAGDMPQSGRAGSTCVNDPHTGSDAPWTPWIADYLVEDHVVGQTE